MFTGLIEEIGTIKSITPFGRGRRIIVEASKVMQDLKIDDSVAIDGVCQTVVSINHGTFEVEAVEETLRKTTFPDLRAGHKVNLERALRLSDRLGGHLVQGHVDCTGRIESISKESAGIIIRVAFPATYSKYVIPQGSICINGVSLTVARLESISLTVSIIPHTWDNTTLNRLYAGSQVNIEFDLIGKYLENLMQIRQKTDESKGSVWDEYLDQPDL